MKKKVLIFVLVLGVVFAVIAIPIIINELYLINSGYITVWEGADVLAFYGALLGAIGTVVLGLVAWRQNERLLRLEETKYNLELRPFIILTDWKISSFNIQEILSNPSHANIVSQYLVVGDIHKADFQIFLTFTNTTDSFLTAEYLKSEYINNHKSTGWEVASIYSLNSKMRIHSNASDEICLLGTKSSLSENFREGVIKISFLMENRIGDRYVEEFDLSGEIFDAKNIFGNAFLYIKADNYRVFPADEVNRTIVKEDEERHNEKTENAHAE